MRLSPERSNSSLHFTRAWSKLNLVHALYTYIAAPLEVYKLVSRDIGALAAAISKSTITHCMRVCVCADPFTFLRRDICFQLSPQHSLFEKGNARADYGRGQNIDTILMSAQKNSIEQVQSKSCEF